MILPPVLTWDPSSSTEAANGPPGNSNPIVTRISGPQHTADDSNLAAKRPGGEHKLSSTAKGKSDTNPPLKSVKLSEVPSNAIPVPAPDTGLASTGNPLAIHTGILPVVPQPSATFTVTPLASITGLSSLSTSTSMTTSLPSDTIVPTGSPGGTSRALGAGQANHSGNNNPKHLPPVAIVLICAGITVMLLVGVASWRHHRRPRKRSCPTPSLPILQDPFADQPPLKADDESLFGGKERNSAVARPNSNGLYPWVPYTPKPSETLAALGVKCTAPNPPPLCPLPSPPRPAVVGDKWDASVPIHVPLPVNKAPSQPAVQQMQQAFNRASRRVSTMSMSIYPMSPQSSHTNAGVGLAISSASPLTADGTRVLERKRSKEKLPRGRQSYRHSLAATEYVDIYGGAQVTSPALPSSAPAATAPIKSALRKSTSVHTQGRARVKPGYIPGVSTPSAALRTSSTVAGLSSLSRAGNRVSVMGSPEPLQYVLPPLSTTVKSEAHRERDTRALASALGLASPAPPSPAITLTPDDSITLAGDRDRRRSRSGPSGGAHRRAPSEALLSPTTETSARLGNLLLEDFANTSLTALPSTRAVAGGMVTSGSKSRVVPRKNVSANTQPRTADRPPRVPSPPPLPSLAQMALAHTNPEEYADYRSPTYSIYGLYEAERKSRMQSEAGF